MADPQPLPVGGTAVRDQLEAALRAELSHLLSGTVDQIDGPIRDASNRLLVAARRGRKDLVDEARDQLLLAIEQRKLAARAGMESTFNVILSRGLGLLFDGVVAGLSGLKVKP
jgi:hypothetical protein